MFCSRPKWCAWVVVWMIGLGACDAGDPVTPPDEDNGTASVASISVTADRTRVIGTGVVLQLTAVVRDNKNALRSDIVLTWTSSDAAVATVDTQGQVTTAGVGTARIEAEAEGITGAVSLEVLPEGVQRLVLSSAHTVLPSDGVVEQVTVTAEDALGAVVVNPDVTWSSSNPAVATIDAAGRVTTGAHGTAIITGRSGTAEATRALMVVATTGVGDTDLDLELLPLFTQLNPAFPLQAPTGMSAALVVEGKLVMARGYGLADPASGTAVEPTSLFRVASVSKPITAVAILRLVAQGRLDLDARLLDLVPQLVPDGGVADARAHDITVRLLLEHRAGWDRAIGPNPLYHLRPIAEEMGVASPPSHTVMGQWLFGQPLHFVPNSRYVYNNMNYFLLGQVIEAVTGTPYESHVREDVLVPLGISAMRTGATLAAERLPEEVRYHHLGSATSVFDSSPGTLPAPYGGFFDLSLMNASGGWVASVVDLARFARAVQTPTMLLPEDLHTYMTTDHSGSGVYGAGWILAGNDYYHTGALEGTNSMLMIHADGHILVLLFNGNINISFESFLALIRQVEAWPDHDLFDQY